MWEDILLALARITDPPRSVGEGKLDHPGLDRIMPDQALTQEVRDLIAAAVSNCSFAEDWLNRRLAHNDLDLKLKQPAAPLVSVVRSTPLVRCWDGFTGITTPRRRLSFRHSEHLVARMPSSFISNAPCRSRSNRTNSGNGNSRVNKRQVVAGQREERDQVVLGDPVRPATQPRGGPS
jgi:hypothetical protein